MEGLYLASRKRPALSLTHSGQVMEQWAEEQGRDLGIRVAYVVLEGRQVTLGECVDSSGEAVVGAITVVVVVVVFVVMIVVVLVVSTGQTQDQVPEGPEVKTMPRAAGTLWVFSLLS